MSIDLNDGYIFFIESDAVDNQNWVTVGDPDLINLVNFTEGEDYCKLKLPKEFRKWFTTGMEIVDSGGGNSYQLRWNRRAYKLLSTGIETSRANADLVEGFFMRDRHTSPSPTIYKDYYLIFRFAASDYVNFTDDGGTRREYCRGGVENGEEMWVYDNPKNYILKLNFRSIWN